MNIGPWSLTNNVFVAPMAGVTDRPFRQLCKRLGAGYAVSEMAASNPQLWQTVKSSRRLNHDGESDPVSVQIAGADPQMMAQAAVFNIGKGARVIDINMGCPVKKVCNVASGSALLRHEDLVAKILETVVNACTPLGIPVTLKTRTGWDREHRNALRIAYLAQETGIAALTLHAVDQLAIDVPARPNTTPFAKSKPVFQFRWWQMAISIALKKPAACSRTRVPMPS